MSKTSLYTSAILALAVGGLLFSGYISFQKLFAGSCVFGSTCPTFLGYPACYFGFAMFFVLAALSFALAASARGKQMIAGWVATVAGVGAFFALYFSVLEVPAFFASGVSLLSIPSCVVGLLIYAAVLYLAVYMCQSLAKANL